MTCLSVEPSFRLPAPAKGVAVRAAVFWAFILMVIASPAVLSAYILLHG